MNNSTRLERLVCALAAGEMATGTEDGVAWSDEQSDRNETFAEFIVTRALALEKALDAAEKARSETCEAIDALCGETSS